MKKSRLARLEQLLKLEDTWIAPAILSREFPGEQLEVRLEEIRGQALEAGWKPESGRPYVVIIDLDESEAES